MPRLGRTPSRLGAIAGALVAGLALAACTASGPPGTKATGPIVEYDFVAFVQQSAIPWSTSDTFEGVPARVLSADPSIGRYAAVLNVPAGYRRADGAALPISTELYVIEGSLRFGDDRLGTRDYAFVPPGVPFPEITSEAGARVLMFHAPSTPDVEALRKQQARGYFVTLDRDARWSPGTVSRAAGVDVPLEVKFLRKDPYTDARTWLVRIAPGTKVPWERHSTTEEGFLLEGDYRLAECLRAGSVSGDYAPGGYFHRPGGILHSGPESGTRTGAVWVMRSPGTLDVQFYTECREGRGEGPIGTPAPQGDAAAASP
jgi:quercetin dioxygenase-like cupin family protein